MINISIIIPVYNSEIFLKRCLDSVTSQVYSDFEVILVNDGSNDSSLKICEYYSAIDNRFRVFSKSNGGVSSSRNFGLSKAMGNYIVFIDSDDYIDSYYLQSYLDKLNIIRTDIVCQGYRNDFKDSKIDIILEKADYSDSIITEAIYLLELNECLSAVWNKIFKRDIIENNNIRFNEHISLGEDKIFTLIYLQNITTISILDKCYYNYNRTEENTLSKKHHDYKNLKFFIEEEYFYFKNILNKYPSEKLLKAINGRYGSFNKFILLWMYNPKEKIPQQVICDQVKLIKDFYKSNKVDSVFERELPVIVAKFVYFGFIMRLLLRIKNLIPNIYSLFRNVKR